MKKIPCPQKYEDVKSKTEDDSHVNGQIVREAAGRKDVVKVDSVG